MSECLLAASPSWYCSRVSDCSPQGTFIFGAKKTLYLLDVSGNEPVYKDQITAHQERVTSLSICPHEGEDQKCATAGEDFKIKIWDLINKVPLLEHGEHRVCS